MFGIFNRQKGHQMDVSIMKKLRACLDDEGVKDLMQYGSDDDYHVIRLGQVVRSSLGDNGEDLDLRPYKDFIAQLVETSLPDGYQVSQEVIKMNYRETEFQEGVLYVAKTEKGVALKDSVIGKHVLNSMPNSMARTC